MYILQQVFSEDANWPDQLTCKKSMNLDKRVCPASMSQYAILSCITLSYFSPSGVADFNNIVVVRFSNSYRESFRFRKKLFCSISSPLLLLVQKVTVYIDIVSSRQVHDFSIICGDLIKISFTTSFKSFKRSSRHFRMKVLKKLTTRSFTPSCKL